MLVQKAIVSYSSNIFVQFLTLAATIIVARIVGPSVLGTVAFGLAFAKMFQFVARLGAGTANIKLISQGENQDECIGTYTRIKLYLILLYVIVTLSFFIVQKYIFNYRFESEIHEYVIYISILIVFLNEFIEIPRSVFSANTEQAKKDIPENIKSILYQVLRIIVVVLGYKAIAIALSNLAASVIIIPVYLYLFKHYKIGKYNKKLAIKYRNIMIPVIFVGITSTIIASADKVILQYITCSEQVGYYVAGFRVGGFIRLIGGSVGILFFPTFSKAISNDQREIINNYVIKFQKFSLFFIFPFIAVVVICSDIIVEITLGKDFLPAVPVLSIITIALFFNTLTRPFSSILNGLGLFKLQAKVSTITAVVLIISAFIFVSPFLLDMQSKGMAFSLLCSYIFMGLIFFFKANKHLKELNINPVIPIVIYSFIFLFLGFLLYEYIPDNYISKICFIVIYIFIYFFIGYIMNLIKKDDWRMLKELFNIRKILFYIKSEILNKDENSK